jgi:hypothetical protein
MYACEGSVYGTYAWCPVGEGVVCVECVWRVCQVYRNKGGGGSTPLPGSVCASGLKMA